MLAIKNIVFLAVGTIVLLHTIAQHEHSGTNNILELKAHNECGSVLEDILITFSLNHGEGHLEHFVQVQLPVSQLLLNEIIIIAFGEHQNIFNISNPENIYTFKDYPPDPLRGPPANNIA